MFNTFEELTYNIKNVNNEYIQISNGKFQGNVKNQQLNNLLVQNSYYNVQSIQHGVTSKDFYTFGINLSSSNILFNGNEIKNNFIVVFKPNQEYTVINKCSNYHDFFIQIDKDIIENTFGNLTTSLFPIISNEIIVKFNLYSKKIGNLNLEDEEELYYLIKKTIYSSNNKFKNIKYFNDFNKIVSFINKHINENLSVTEIAENFKITDRTLRNIFSTQAYISPNKYMKLLKLNQLKKSLILEKEKSISKLIEKYNLSSHSYTSLEFKKIFENTPYEFKSKIISNFAPI